jgi:hypothetical protein
MKTVVQRHLDRRADARIRASQWLPPDFTVPMPIAEDSLTLLGSHRGSRYWQHPTFGELADGKRVLREPPPDLADDGASPFCIPNGPIIEVRSPIRTAPPSSIRAGQVRPGNDVAQVG